VGTHGHAGPVRHSLAQRPVTPLLCGQGLQCAAVDLTGWSEREGRHEHQSFGNLRGSKPLAGQVVGEITHRMQRHSRLLESLGPFPANSHSST
jgi:hypothetical protein